MFHGEAALCKILKFQGETANFSEKFQKEIQVFPGENMEPYSQNLKISGRNTAISWRKWRISWRNSPLFLPEKKGSWSWRKIKSIFFFLSLPALYVCTYKVNSELIVQSNKITSNPRTTLSIGSYFCHKWLYQPDPTPTLILILYVAWHCSKPCSLVDACLLGMRTVMGSIFGFGNILSWRLVMKSFLWPFSKCNRFVPVVPLIQVGQLSVVHLVLVNRLGSQPKKCGYVSWLSRRKTTVQRNKTVVSTCLKMCCFMPQEMKLCCSYFLCRIHDGMCIKVRLCYLTHFVFSLQKFLPSWSRTKCRSQRSRCWICYRYRRRRGRPRNSTTTQIIRRHDSDSYFCWSIGSIRTNCCTYFGHKEQELDT